MRYSAFALLRQALAGHRGWPRAWRDAAPKPAYDAIVVGGGGHGLASAYYLAKEHGLRNVAVLEKGWIGGGNTGRNTTIIRTNYMIEGNTDFYEFSLKLWEALSRDLNYNIMVSQRGQYNLVHSDAQMEAATRRGNLMRLNGIDAELLDRETLRERLPLLDWSQSARFPILGALYQGRAGTARHDAVAWGYARGADRLGVDIVQNCEVTGFLREGARVVGVETARGEIRAPKVGIAVAGHSGELARKAGLRSVSPQQRIRTGAILFDEGQAAKGHGLGHVSSATFSPALGGHIALGFLAEADRRKGRRVVAHSPVHGEATPLEVVDPVFVDPEGARVRA